MRRTTLTLIMAALTLCAALTVRSSAQDADSDSARAVFVMTNAADKNAVLVFARAEDGSLHEVHEYLTGGRGSGGNIDPLESQGSLVLSKDHSLLFAANAGSGEVSVFRVDGSSLALVDRVPSGGSEPNAIAQNGPLVYVLNTGGSSSVVGFSLHEGRLTQIANSVRFLTTNTSGAASLSFSPDRQFLAVTERLTGNIDIFRVQSDGTLSSIVVNRSAGPGAFAVQFAPNGTALVSETGPAGVPNGSAITSYAVLADGTLSTISKSVPTFGAANCWNAITPDGRFVYVSNAGSSTISGFAIHQNGELTPLAGTVLAANPQGATNLDVTVSADGLFLYTLNSRNGTIGIFAINQKDGTLTNLGAASGISPASGFNGIAAN